MDSITWQDKAGTVHTEQLTADAVKRAMLDVGTQGWVRVANKRGKNGHIYNWGMANHIRRLLMKNYYIHG